MPEKTYSPEAIDFANFLVDREILSQIFAQENARTKGRGMLELFGDICQLLQTQDMKKVPGLIGRKQAIDYLIDSGILREDRGNYFLFY